MTRTEVATPSTSHRRRLSVGVALAAGVIGATALVAVPAIADSGTGSEPAPSHVVVCDSGVVDHGDGILTSSAYAVRVADGETPALPEGCYPH